MKRKIVLFALSWRNGGICVAGKDISNKNWIRPVTATGPIPSPQVSGLKLGDVVELDLGANKPTGHQTENYEYNPGPWKKAIYLDRASLKQFIDTPSHLWLSETPASKNASISMPEITATGVSKSLYFIEISDMTVKHEKKDYDGIIRDKFYGVFDYNKVEYTLSITDPAFTHKFQELGEYKIKNPAICVSLSEPFQRDNRCYKLIAGVIA